MTALINLHDMISDAIERTIYFLLNLVYTNNTITSVFFFD